MLKGLRRMVGKTEDGQVDWDLTVQLEEVPEAGPELEAKPEVRLPPQNPNYYDPNADSDYYSNLVKSSIASGGRYGDQSISVSWLRMILAGLEGGDDSVEAMLFDPRQDGPETSPDGEYSEIFPHE